MNTQPSTLTPLKPTVGVGIVIIRDGRVLLIRRGQPPRQGEWSIPGGRQEMGETVRETAEREAMEETALTVTNLRLIDVVDTFSKAPDGTITSHYTLVDFRADAPAGEPRAGGDAADVRWVSLDELEAYIVWSETVRIIRTAAAMA